MEMRMRKVHGAKLSFIRNKKEVRSEDSINLYARTELVVAGGAPRRLALSPSIHHLIIGSSDRSDDHVAPNE